MNSLVGPETFGGSTKLNSIRSLENARVRTRKLFEVAGSARPSGLILYTVDSATRLGRTRRGFSSFLLFAQGDHGGKLVRNTLK